MPGDPWLRPWTLGLLALFQPSTFSMGEESGVKSLCAPEPTSPFTDYASRTGTSGFSIQMVLNPLPGFCGHFPWGIGWEVKVDARAWRPVLLVSQTPVRSSKGTQSSEAQRGLPGTMKRWVEHP